MSKIIYTILTTKYEQHEDIEFPSTMAVYDHLNSHEAYLDFALLIYDNSTDEVIALWFEGKMWTNGY